MTTTDVDRSTPELSTREIEVLCTWLRSSTKDQACRELFISIGTMNTHLTRIRVKYERVGRPAGTKALLLARALQDGFITANDLDEYF